MQPTPAPSPPPTLTQLLPPAVAAEDHPIEYPTPPQNKGSAPFRVLVALFEKLQSERKPDKRRKLIQAWFNVSRLPVQMTTVLTSRQCSTGERM